MVHNTKNTLTAIAVSLILAGCGGGGGGMNNPAPDRNTDHSNTPSGATTISLESTFSGTIDSATDVDYFQLGIKEEGILTISTSGNANPDIQVYDAGGDEIPGRTGSYIVDITKSILDKGRHVLVKLSGGTPGESYTGSAEFATSDMNIGQQTDLTPHTSAKRVILGADTIIPGDQAVILSYFSDPALNAGLPKVIITPHGRASLSEFVIAKNGKFPSSREIKESIALFHTGNPFSSAEISSVQLTPSDHGIDGVTVSGDEATKQFQYGGWGRWNYHELDVSMGTTISSNIGLEGHTTAGAHPVSVGKVPDSPLFRNLATGVEMTARYNGYASIWDSDSGGPGDHRGRINTTKPAPMSLTYKTRTETIDVFIDYNLAPDGFISYLIPNVHGGPSFEYSGQDGSISGSFYGPNHEEAGGVFYKFYNRRTHDFLGDSAGRAIVGAFSAFESLRREE